MLARGVEVCGHFCGIVVRAGSVWACNQDHQRFGHGSSFRFFPEECDTCFELFQVVLNASKWLGSARTPDLSMGKYMQLRAKSRKNMQTCKVAL